ncbi:MAG: hypothetical protein VX656_14345 [Candidatus Latescibacterota bacterium]|nr:hypothetical protein [Candidatus Latescibacterota bacterium]
MVTLAGGVLLLGEGVGLFTTMGGLLILLGVYLVQRPSTDSATPEANTVEE